MTEAAAIMQLSEVGFAYHRGAPVLSQITASVRPGRLCAVIGPNAAGKTTLLRLMLGQLSPSGGRVELDGQRVRRWPLAQRAAWLSFVPQRSATGFAFTVAQVVAMGRFALPWRAEAFDEAVVACELGDLLTAPFNELSVGQQQRVLLARSVAQAHGEGRVMFLDEPVSAMDMLHIHRTMHVLRDLTQRGVAVVTVLHDLNLAARYADDVWLLHGGNLAATGSWDAVLTPEVLGPVYGVDMRIVATADHTHDGHDRPVFDVRLQHEAPGAYNQVDG